MVDQVNSTPQDELFPAAVNVALKTERFHTGNGFTAAHEFSNIAGGGTADVLLQSPPNGDVPHVTGYAFTPDVSAERVRLFEGAAVSDVGASPDAVTDLNRREANSPSTTVTVDPTVDSTGTELTFEGVPDGSGASSGSGTVEAEGIDWTLAADTNYLLRFENTTNNQADAVLFTLDWYRIQSGELKS